MAAVGQKKSGCGYLHDALSIVVVGASGDLAKKKTFPALLDLYRHDFLPKSVIICGYSRSSMSDEDLRTKIKPFLTKKGSEGDPVIDKFLERVHYRSGESHCHMRLLLASWHVGRVDGKPIRLFRLPASSTQAPLPTFRRTCERTAVLSRVEKWNGFRPTSFR